MKQGAGAWRAPAGLPKGATAVRGFQLDPYLGAA
jgi:hypothetical protein